MLETIRVASACIDAQPDDLDGNLTKIRAAARQAANLNASLLLLPELSLTGFIPNHPVGDHNRWLRDALRLARTSALPLSHIVIQDLARLAHECGLVVATGLLEDDGNRLFNTHVLIGANGILARFRKLHVPMFEMPFYQPGTPPEVVDTSLGRVGINICFDAFLPESTRLLALQNAEIVLFPFAADPSPGTVEAWQQWAQPALQCRCQENGVFGLACNYAGRVTCLGVEQTFPGGTLAIDPRGQILLPMETLNVPMQLTVTEFHAESLRSARAEPEYLYRFRRPEIYGPLSQL